MNCKPGDLAYIVGVDDERFAENIGHVVEVVGSARAEFEGVDPTTVYWFVRANEPGLVAYQSGVFRRGMVEGHIRDSNLRPITPPAPEQLRIEDAFDPMFVALGIHSRTYA